VANGVEVKLLYIGFRTFSFVFDDLVICW